MSKLLILGGSDAGISAALRTRELDTTWEVTIVVEDAFPNYSICGFPFYLSEAGISLLLNHQAQEAAVRPFGGISVYLSER